MDDLFIPATERTPEVAFAFSAARLRLAGESYPEDVGAFYAPVFRALEAYLAELGNGACRFDLELLYFNSSTAKAIMLLLAKLDAAAAKGAAVSVHWYYDPEDDTMLELGQEFAEDLEHASVTLEPMPAE
jgi:hypothetical protein